MPRRKAEPTVALTCRIPRSLKERLDKECEERIVGPAFIVRAALQRFFEQHGHDAEVAYPAETPQAVIDRESREQ